MPRSPILLLVILLLDAADMSRTGLTRMVVTGADHAHTMFSSDPADTVTWLNMATSAPAWTPTVAVF